MADKDDKRPDHDDQGKGRARGVEIHDARAPSRRNFLKSVGATSLAAATAPAWARVGYVNHDEQEPQDKRADEGEAPAKGTQRITLNVNGQAHTLDVTPNMVLLDVLRHQLALTGTKKGCDIGQCGACTVHVNGVSINSCLSLAVMHDGDEVTTVEGLGQNGKLHPIQQAFLDHDAYQCGYCTPGQMMSAVAILNDAEVASDDAAVREAMSGNICRCGAYKNILSAIQTARKNV
ncbi:(2Fe-2S)-binding protein [Phytohalomonas tamaricis]|uniref:(2Fe-2S)-binding protein n=1 Tax=Phytohalomonas tamaricis TaxID=2081032 RepID=UPI000D0B389F|nr:(2Fe-2S)-binding protein [Phytohalomonas tamaricis]